MQKTFELWDNEEKRVIEVVAKRQGREWRAFCPKHADKKHPNLDINEEKQVFLCRACGWKGHIYQSNLKERRVPKPRDLQEAMEKAEKYHRNLSDSLLIFLKEARGLTAEIIRKYKIGLANTHPEYGGGERITIPMLKNKKCINIRFHSLKDEKPKDYPLTAGLPYAVYLYPENQLRNKEIWLCEGELDVLCALSHGLPAITVTSGAGTWKNEFTPLFDGKKVNIVFDCDEPGKKGAERVAEILSRVAQVRIIDLGLREGQDVTDWFVNYGKSKEELEKLAKRTPIFEKLTKAEQEIRNNALELASQSLTVKELLETKLPEEEFLIRNGLMPKGGYILLAGATKEGKTILALQMGLHLISATPFLEQFPIKEKRRVLYLYAENTLNGLNNILDKQIAGLQQSFEISNDDLDNLILQGTKG
ncbi:MAG: AAA family ATPase, partial [Candidatus Aerophobetes bacterium]|nr:AAA family ATPase [Candidatus Aerophobetes bacterium]